MKIQDNINSMLTSIKYGINNVSNISNKYKASAIKYQAIILADGKEKSYYDFKNQRDEEIDIDKDLFIDQARMNSLKQYDKYIDARDDSDYKVKVKVR